MIFDHGQIHKRTSKKKMYAFVKNVIWHHIKANKLINNFLSAMRNKMRKEKRSEKKQQMAFFLSFWYRRGGTCSPVCSTHFYFISLIFFFPSLFTFGFFFRCIFVSDIFFILFHRTSKCEFISTWLVRHLIDNIIQFPVFTTSNKRWTKANQSNWISIGCIWSDSTERRRQKRWKIIFGHISALKSYHLHLYLLEPLFADLIWWYSSVHKLTRSRTCNGIWKIKSNSKRKPKWSQEREWKKLNLKNQ